MAGLHAKSVRRREDQRLLTGQGTYAADAAPPGMAVVYFLRSPHAHADIVRIDTTGARTLQGILGVFTASDLTDISPIPGGIGFQRLDGNPAPKTDRPLLAHDRVRFVGEPVAMVIAETRTAAQDAAEAIAVEYAPRPVVTDPMAALEDGAATVWDEVPDNLGFLWQRGDAAEAAAALAQSAHVTRLTFSVSRVTANPLEPRGAWACLAPDGRIELHASHQSPFALRNGLAAGVFQVAPADIRVLPGDVGGSFGMKSGVHLEPALVAWAARRLNRPVRWIADRTEGFLTDEPARE
ncbi:MAG TPA: molybdopterin cofactor-binding domain-containing protein, partial [Rhodopila sp.]|nr:molybdopterin cofactor-binding domain-containing protein [Rhodopila sp.]